MYRFKVAVILFSAFVLAACAPSTVSGLKADSAGVMTFEADENYMSVYGKILNCVRCHYEAPQRLSNIVVQAELDEGAGQGTVSLKEQRLVGGDDMLLHVEVIKTGAERTTVNVYYASPDEQSAAAKIEIYYRRPTTCE